MKYIKLINKYIFPIIIILLLIAFIIYASLVKEEGFCMCPSGTALRNGGCYSCEAGFTLNSDYYNTHCTNGKDIRPAIITNVKC
jgi:hypothetical protein